MLRFLHIENLAVVEKLHVEFEPSFTVITGETGAGKSILLKSIGLLLGERGDASMVRSGAEKATIEGEFDLSLAPLVLEKIKDLELDGDEDNFLHVRRTVGKGRQRVFLNGHLASVGILADLTQGLLEVSGQHDHQNLTRRDYHREILDRYSNLIDVLNEYKQSFETLKTLHSQLSDMEAQKSNREQRIEDLRFEIQQIEEIAPLENENIHLEDERKRLIHVVRLQELTAQAENAIYSKDGAAIDLLGAASHSISQAMQLDNELEPLGENLSDIQDRLSDVARQLSSYLSHLEDNPQRLEEVDDRLEALRRLMRKHGESVSAVLQAKSNMEHELFELEDIEENTAQLKQKYDTALDKTEQLADTLSTMRKKSAPQLCQELQQELVALGMANTSFSFTIEELSPHEQSIVTNQGKALGSYGYDKIELLFSPNPGQEVRSISKIASGGELSRVMLAVKVVLAGNDSISSYLFDEVDTGVGGALGDAIGHKIDTISAGKQAIVITHLPQLAAWASNHLFIEKEVKDNKTYARLTPLSQQQREKELARMLDGDNATESGLLHARNLLEKANKKIAS